MTDQSASRSMREKEGFAGALIGAVLGSIQFNLGIGIPAYVVLAAMLTEVTLLPNTLIEILIFLGCQLPVFLFTLWAAMTRGPAVKTGEEEIMRRLANGEFDEEFSKVARVIASPIDELEADERRLRNAMDRRKRAMDAAVEELIPQVIHLTPEEAFEMARKETNDVTIARMVQLGVWEIRIGRLDNKAFERAATEVAENEPLTTDYGRKMLIIDHEREKRGLGSG